MTDYVPSETRRRIMRSIQSKDTRPELLIRKALFRRGFRYRIHVRSLPGSPDIVFPARKAVIQVEGCFWHGHGCAIAKAPNSNGDFWAEKLHKTISRDERNLAGLLDLGWRVLRVWECALGKGDEPTVNCVVEQVIFWLKTESVNAQIPNGKRT